MQVGGGNPVIPETFKTVAPQPAPIGSTLPVDFREVATAIGPRIRVSATARAEEGWFIQYNTVDPDAAAEWFTVPGSARLETLVYYDANPKPKPSPRWWRAIRKS